MGDYSLDEVDAELLELLQKDARYSAVELAEKLGVSDNTVHNRMERLEEAGIITGFTATLDHKQAGLEFHYLFVCTARISDRGRVADEVLDLPGVLEVTELMTGQRNLHIKVIGASDEDITNLARQLDDLDLEINDEVLLKSEHTRSINYDDLT